MLGVGVGNGYGPIDWEAVAANGIDFVYIKATEGTQYVNPSFDRYYRGSYDAGLIRGAYHFALPNRSGGAAQARFFATNGGGWSPDGQTLPMLLDIENNPYGAACYGLSDQQMVTWIAEFSTTVKQMSGRYPAIYTTTNWWRMCTGDYGGFADTNPPVIASWGDDPYPLPNGWGDYTMWQNGSTDHVDGIDGDVSISVFNGTYEELVAFATCADGGPC